MPDIIWGALDTKSATLIAASAVADGAQKVGSTQIINGTTKATHLILEWDFGADQDLSSQTSPEVRVALLYEFPGLAIIEDPGSGGAGDINVGSFKGAFNFAEATLRRYSVITIAVEPMDFVLGIENRIGAALPATGWTVKGTLTRLTV